MRLAKLGSATLLALLLAVPFAAPGAGATSDQPDLFVQGQWDPRPSGRNVHGTCDTTDQSSGGGGFAGNIEHFVITIQNDGDAPARYAIDARDLDVDHFGAFTVNFGKNNGKIITGRVFAGTFRTKSLAPRAKMTIIMRVDTVGGVRNVCVSAVSDTGAVDEINVGLSAL